MREGCDKGVVLSVEGDLATVEIRQTDGCFSCGIRESCAIFSNSIKTITANNQIGAKVGDVVELSMDLSIFLRAGFIVFILPLILMFAFYSITAKFIGDGLSILSGFIGLIIGIVLAFLLGKGKVAEKSRYKIVSIESQIGSPEQGKIKDENRA